MVDFHIIFPSTDQVDYCCFVLNFEPFLEGMTGHLRGSSSTFSMTNFSPVFLYFQHFQGISLFDKRGDLFVLLFNCAKFRQRCASKLMDILDSKKKFCQERYSLENFSELAKLLEYCYLWNHNQDPLHFNWFLFDVSHQVNMLWKVMAFW